MAHSRMERIVTQPVSALDGEHGITELYDAVARDAEAAFDLRDRLTRGGRDWFGKIILRILLPLK